MMNVDFLARKTYEILNELGEISFSEKEAIPGIMALLEKGDIMELLEVLTKVQHKLEYTEENRYKKAEIEALAYAIINCTLED